MSKTNSPNKAVRRAAKHRTTVVHARDRKGTHHIVGIGNLRVLVSEEDGYWYAQGLEIDYIAQAKTAKEVRERFARGLRDTIDQHLRIFGTIEKLLVPAPAPLWSALALHAFTQVSRHKLPKTAQISEVFEGIDFFERKAA